MVAIVRRVFSGYAILYAATSRICRLFRHTRLFERRLPAESLTTSCSPVASPLLTVRRLPIPPTAQTDIGWVAEELPTPPETTLPPMPVVVRRWRTEAQVVVSSAQCAGMPYSGIAVPPARRRHSGRGHPAHRPPSAGEGASGGVAMARRR